MKLVLKILAGSFAVLLAAAFVCLKKLDTTPYRQTQFYREELRAIDSAGSRLRNLASDTVLLAGWSCVNLLPPFTTPIAIDAHRGGKHFEGVHDSVYVRAFVFQQGSKKVAYISADLLIIPPSVSKMFDTILKSRGYDQSNIFFTATHTHTSFGGWHQSLVGEIFAGKYDERVPVWIADKISQSILQAEKNCEPATLGFAAYPTRQLVYNRLITDMAKLPAAMGEVDSLLRVVKIKKQSGETAAIVTFAAHNTVFHEQLMKLSADWCGGLMRLLRQSGKINMASFSAGAVGSHGPYPHSKNQEAEAKYMAEGTAHIILANFDSIKTEATGYLQMMHVALPLREPNWRLSEHIVLRPWLFHSLFGNELVYINTLRIGPVFFAGFPGDFSGELVNEIDSAAAQKQLHLLCTSFNGGYVGYITDSRRYQLNTYETRTMGWFGPGTGDYFSEVAMRLINK